MIEKQMLKLLLGKKFYTQYKGQVHVMYFKVASALCLKQYRRHMKSMMLI